MRRRRRLWIVLLASPLVLLAADTLYWWIAISNLEHGFAAWQAESRAAGGANSMVHRYEVAGRWQQR